MLAAGAGTRLGPLTRRLAKPMMPVGNRPVMEHILRGLHAAGVRRVYANLHYRPGDMRGYFGNGAALGLSLAWLREPELTGPAGGVAAFASALAGDPVVLVVSGDAVHDVDLRAFARFHRQRGALLSVVLREVPDARRFGVARVAADGRIDAFVEKPPLAPGEPGLVSCGIYCVSRACLDRIPRGTVYDFGRDLIPAMAAAGDAVYGYVTDAYWEDVGSPEALLRANLDAAAGRVRLRLPGTARGGGVRAETGVRIQPGARVQGPVLLGRGCRIEAGAIVLGPCVVGPGARIGAGATVAGSLLLPGAVVAPGSKVDGLLVGDSPRLPDPRRAAASASPHPES